MRLLTTPLRSYWTFLRANTRFVAFGFVLTLASSFGQTFFIGLFNAPIREAFDLSDGGFGMLYSLATLASGFSIIWLGTLIDRLDLRALTLAVCGGMILACLLMAASPWLATLALAIYLLRLNGQGLLGHISITSMSRYFTAGRGKAISIATLGYPAGEAVLPIMAVGIVSLVGWRMSWLLIAALLTVLLVPLVWWLLVGHGDRHRAHLAAVEAAHRRGDATGGAAARSVERRQWTRREAVRDVRFHLLLPAALTPAFVATGLFFHQARLMQEQGWTAEWWATCFVGFAAAQLFAGTACGELIDRYGAARLMPVFLTPLIVGLVILAAVDHVAVAPALLALMGLTSGTVGTIVSATWAELYGVRYLGAIRALSTSLMVFSTSLSPALMGWLIDADVAIESMAAAFAGVGGAASALAFIALRLRAGKGAVATPEG